MIEPSFWLAAAALAFVGVQFTMAALLLTLVYRPRRKAPAGELPPISVLIPCEGLEPGLEENLEAAVRAPYPAPRQVIFCTGHPDDPANEAIDRVLARLGQRPVEGVEAVRVSSHRAPAALNRKVRHLAAALTHARHPVIVAADSDARFDAETLPVLVSSLVAERGCGLAFAPPRFPENGSLADQTLNYGFTSHIHAFYTLKALTDFLNVERPVVGTLIAVHRSVLDTAGGYRALAGHIGDDLELSRRVRAQGLSVVAAPVTVRCPGTGMALGDLAGKLHRWIVVAGSYGAWRLVSYPFLIVPLPFIALATALATVYDPVLPELHWLPVAAMWLSRVVFGVVIGWRCYGRLPRVVDLALLPLWETLLAGASLTAMVHRTVTWRGRQLRIQPGGMILSLHEPSRAGVPEVPANKGWLGRVVLPMYNRHLFRGHFGAVWLRGLDQLELCRTGAPVIFVANHCSYWDGLVAFLLHSERLTEDFYIVMEDRQLRRYKFMSRAGAFSIRRGDPRSAQKTLRYAEELLSAPGRALWLFPQGAFHPADRRPLRFEGGAAHLLKWLHGAWVVPVGLHYTLRAGPKPECFVSIGTPRFYRDEALEVADIARRLEQLVTDQVDTLKSTLIATGLETDPDGFERLLEGRSGVAERWDRVREAVGLNRW